MDAQKRKEITDAAGKSARSLLNSVPVLVGTVLLVSLVMAFTTPEMYAGLFSGNVASDSFIGAVIGSVSAGNPMMSYIIGGELRDEGIHMFAVASFIVAWVTVGVIQLPAEMKMLGRRFALWRNGISFLFSIIVGIVTVTLINLV